MPILKKDIDLWPTNLLSFQPDPEGVNRRWFALFVKPNHDKVLMRKLLTQGKKYCAFLMPHSGKTPGGRKTLSYKPLFPGYVFLFGNDTDRYDAVCTDSVLKTLIIPDQLSLHQDLNRIQSAILAGYPIGQAQEIDPGRLVKIVSGPLSGFTGKCVQRAGKSRLILNLSFIQQSAWVEVEDSLIEAI
ncbi:MAG: hypothetical protein JNL58_31425 [Planctomyces sp.]|nr:hypothetical protein [Planctomyces sp.]